MLRTLSSPRWALILTPPGERKTDKLLAVAAALGGAGLRIAGFAQQRLPGGGPRRYELRCLGAAEPAVPIARRGGTPGPGEEAFCNCVFRPDAFATARAWLARDLPGCDVAVLDEISRLEALGGGHADAVTSALAAAPITVLSIRGDRLAALMDRFELDEPLAVLERDAPAAAFVDALLGCRRAAPADGARASCL